MTDRRLAAIMFTDIVGYTSLMADDETSALRMLDKQRELLQPLIESHNGQWHKEMGDGTLSSFTSAADAVHSAIEIQNQCRDSSGFKLRIGIHLGDVVFSEADVFGDGVNIAARIEPLAEPGGIAVSGSVFDTLGSNKNYQTVFLGEKSLKGVSRPLRIYAICNDGLPVPNGADEGGTKFALTAQKDFSGMLPFLTLAAFFVVSMLAFAAFSRKEPDQAENATTSLDVATSAESAGGSENKNQTSTQAALTNLANSTEVLAAETLQSETTGENGRDLSEDKYIPPVVDSEPALVSPASPEIQIAESAVPIDSEAPAEDEEVNSAHPVPVLESSQSQSVDSPRSVLE